MSESKLGYFLGEMNIIMKQNTTESFLARNRKKIYLLRKNMTGTGENIGKYVRNEIFFGKDAGWELVQGEDDFLDFIEVFLKIPPDDTKKDTGLISSIASQMEMDEERAKKYFNILNKIVAKNKE